MHLINIFFVLSILLYSSNAIAKDYYIELDFNKSKINRTSFLLGAHGSIVDAPFSTVLAINNAIKDNPKGSNKLYLNFIKSVNLKSFRFFDSIWWSPNGAEATAHNLLRFNILKNKDIDNYIKNYPYLTGYDLIDFCGRNNLDLVFVTDTMFFSPKEKKSYKVNEFVKDKNLLKQAAYYNAGKFAEYYEMRKYTNKFILEIGNENLNFYPDGEKISIETITEIIKYYSKSIKEHSKSVEIAFTSELFFSNNSFYLLKGYQDILNYAVFHPYGEYFKVENKQMNLNELVNYYSTFLDKSGFKKTQFLLTEYNNSDYPVIDKFTYISGLKNSNIILNSLSNNRVAGIFINDFPGKEIGNFSNGYEWSTTIVKNGISYKPKDKDKTIRWRVLNTGLIYKMIYDMSQLDNIETYINNEDIKMVGLFNRNKAYILITSFNMNNIHLKLKNRNDFDKQIKIQSLSSAPNNSDFNENYEIKKDNIPIMNDKTLVNVNSYSITVLEFNKK